MINYNPQVQKYISQNINPFVQKMIIDAVINRPQNPLRFAIQWLLNYQRSILKQKNLINEQGKNILTQITNNPKQLRSPQSKYKITFRQISSRKSLCSSSKSISDNISQQDKKFITQVLKKNPILKGVQWSQQKMGRIFCQNKLEQYQLLLREEQDHDLFCIVKQGQFDCLRTIRGQNQLIKTYVKGDNFGLSLITGQQDYSSIITKQTGVLLYASGLAMNQVFKQNIFKIKIKN